MEIYIYLVAATLVFGAILPQKGKNRKYYIILLTGLHMFVCAFRYYHLTGDLMKYHAIFNSLSSAGWGSEAVLQEGRNSGFMLLMKLVNSLTGGDFQVLLIVIAVISYTILGYVIYRYSPAPWMSFLVWNCMGFFLFSLSAIKQVLAMAFLMLSFSGIVEKNLKKYLLMMLVAGLFHTPSLIFLPAYWLCQRRVSSRMIGFYIVLGVLIFIFKNQFINFIKSFYYEDDQVFVFSGEIGSRFVMLLGMTLFGILFRDFTNRDYEALFHIMAVATILQMLAGFDNIFTRMADYYFQFSVLYLPMIFFPGNQKDQRARLRRPFPFNRRSLKALSVLLCVFMLWFYWTYNLNIHIAVEVDNYLNYRFMWEVV